MSKSRTVAEKMNSDAGKSLKMLKQAERHKVVYLFRNAHAVAKQNRPISDYKWLCEVDQAKKLDIGNTYVNDKAAVDFISCIAQCEKEKTVQILNDSSFFSFMMDGTTDISGDEQEAIYVRTSSQGAVTERFLNIGSPRSTKSEDLFEHVLAVFKECNVDKGRYNNSSLFFNY
ncbi:uncharacterized protein LOC132724477 [Ruditapes philippinarum]|uniref:uncharacterized protein LOC132724477 n=1 Tax=Ruditapes philippinarum TaxID=129788 RepID=UPI00295B4C3B|nr:uncharacterized protein LOC132724477 [Ruditapes philippinarum]